MGAELALTKLHSATKQVVEGITTAMRTQEKDDKGRDLLLRKLSIQVREVEELFATIRRDQWEKQLNHHLRTWSFRSFPKYFDSQKKSSFTASCPTSKTGQNSLTKDQYFWEQLPHQD